MFSIPHLTSQISILTWSNPSAAFRLGIFTCMKANGFHAGFDAVFHTLLKASPERRPGQAVVEARREDDSCEPSDS
jgi:hypothetical protein